MVILTWIPYLFELDQTFLTADALTAVLLLQQELFVGADGAADTTGVQLQVVYFLVVDEAGVAANSADLAIHRQLEFALGMTKELVDW